MRVQTKARCGECGRVFDLLDEEQASEWYYGHDCEDTGDADNWVYRDGQWWWVADV